MNNNNEIVVTEAMRSAVRREECLIGGHHFDVLLAGEDPEPRSLVCTRCGRAWKVSDG